MKNYPGRWIQSVVSLSVALCALVVSAPSTSAATPPRPVTVMTVNMFQGSELEAVLAATNPTQFVLGVTTTYNELQSSNPSERLNAMADEIVAAHPDVVGLQEAALWRVGTSPYPSGVLYDFVQMLQDDLAARGASYSRASIVNNLDATGPMLDGRWLRFTDRVAVLARADLMSDVSNAQSANYAAAAVVNSPVAGRIQVLDGWASIDAKVRGQNVRFVTTHLSALSPAVQQAEAAELLSGPASATIPVIVAGDFNTDASAAEPTATYSELTGAGFSDAWATVHPADPGLTCCHIGGAAYSQRLDLVLSRGSAVATAASITGDTAASMTPSGLWPSDHAALIATIRVSDT